MAHALTARSNGFVEFAFLKSDGAAWHGLGQPMADDATLEQWLASSGMDWRIQRGKVRYAVDAAGTLQEMPEQHVLFRSDTKAPSAWSRTATKAVQPRQVLEFFKSVAGLKGLDLTAAGTLFDGKRFWATAKIGEACPVSDRDKIGGYLLLSTSADGSMATEARLTTIRVVLQQHAADGARRRQGPGPADPPLGLPPRGDPSPARHAQGPRHVRCVPTADGAAGRVPHRVRRG